MALCICSAPERRPERKQSSARSENAPKRPAGAFHPMRSARTVPNSIRFDNLSCSFLHPILTFPSLLLSFPLFSHPLISFSACFFFLLFFSLLLFLFFFLFFF